MRSKAKEYIEEFTRNFLEKHPEGSVTVEKGLFKISFHLRYKGNVKRNGDISSICVRRWDILSCYYPKKLARDIYNQVILKDLLKRGFDNET